MHAFSTFFDAENPGTAEIPLKMAVMAVPAGVIRVVGVLLVLGVGGGTIRAGDAIPKCTPAPSILSTPQPAWPDNVGEGRISRPFSVTVEYTVDARGVASDAIVVDRDTHGHEREFEKLAIATVLAMKFKGVSQPCRLRTKIVWKLQDAIT